MNISFDRKGPKSKNGLLAMILGTTPGNIWLIKKGKRGKHSKIAAKMKYAEMLIDTEMMPKIRKIEKQKAITKQMFDEIINDVRNEIFENESAYKKNKTS